MTRPGGGAPPERRATSARSASERNAVLRVTTAPFGNARRRASSCEGKLFAREDDERRTRTKRKRKISLSERGEGLPARAHPSRTRERHPLPSSFLGKSSYFSSSSIL